jgi:hypothetical protein
MASESEIKRVLDLLTIAPYCSYGDQRENFR